MRTKPRYRLELEVQPSSVPVAVRLRHVLKALLRTYNFRCLSAVELPADRPPAVSNDAAGGTDDR
jgi:hypothetical protein